jgi:hypothetical protein
LTLPFTLPFTLGEDTPVGGVDLAAQCEAIWEATNRHEKERNRLRDEGELIRLWDGEWGLQHAIWDEYEHSFTWLSNDTGPGHLEVAFDTPAGYWLYDMWGRMERGEKRNVHITVDYCGARWGGRLDGCQVETRDDGDKVVVADFNHDYEDVKWVTVWSNPFLPAFFQAPRVFLLPGPVTWVLKMALHLQLFRFHNPLITIPDDPLDFGSYFDFLDQSTWDIVVKPTTFLEAAESGVVWGIVFSRWRNWHDMAHSMLEDAELSVDCRRYLNGDPAPWEGANLRHGTLVIDIIDKSGVHIGSSNGGSIFDGLFRTAAEFTDDFLDSTDDLILDTNAPKDYFLPGLRLTNKEWPYAVYQEGPGSGIQSSAFVNSPAKGDTVAVGGHSMPGVNEAISASIQAAGDILGSIFQIGSLGGTIDTLLKPLYEDTVLAWISVKSIERAQNSGWSRYHEYFQDGANKAYTIASLMVLRAGFWATKTTLSAQLKVIDGSPFLIGDRGLGHWWVDDRLGFALEDDKSGRIWMDRCRKLELKRGEDGLEWLPTIGDPRMLEDPAQRAWGRIEDLVAGLKELGAW